MCRAIADLNLKKKSIDRTCKITSNFQNFQNGCLLYLPNEGLGGGYIGSNLMDSDGFGGMPDPITSIHNQFTSTALSPTESNKTINAVGL